MPPDVQHISLNPYLSIASAICRVCWNPLDDLTAYCRRCGHAGTCFLNGETMGHMCFQHPDLRATQFCNYCSRPFCDHCLETNTNSRLSLGTWTYHCSLCIAEIARLKQQHLDRDTNYCLHHPDVLVQEKCISCQDRSCEFCTYHPIRGVFRKQIDRIPPCFSCVRNRIDPKVRRCIVKRFAAEQDWSRKVFRF